MEPVLRQSGDEGYQLLLPANVCETPEDLLLGPNVQIMGGTDKVTQERLGASNALKAFLESILAIETRLSSSDTSYAPELEFEDLLTGVQAPFGEEEISDPARRYLYHMMETIRAAALKLIAGAQLITTEGGDVGELQGTLRKSRETLRAITQAALKTLRDHVEELSKQEAVRVGRLFAAADAERFLSKAHHKGVDKMRLEAIGFEEPYLTGRSHEEGVFPDTVRPSFLDDNPPKSVSDKLLEELAKRGTFPVSAAKAEIERFNEEEKPGLLETKESVEAEIARLQESERDRLRALSEEARPIVSNLIFSMQTMGIAAMGFANAGRPSDSAAEVSNTAGEKLDLIRGAGLIWQSGRRATEITHVRPSGDLEFIGQLNSLSRRATRAISLLGYPKIQEDLAKYQEDFDAWYGEARAALEAVSE